MAKHKFFFIILLISFCILAEHSYAQGCCTAGSSTFGGLERGISKNGSLNIAFSFLHNGLNDTYTGREKIQDPLNRSASLSSFNLELEYGLARNVSLLITGSYVIKNRETTIRSNVDNITEVISFDGKGISDVIILGKYEAITPTILSTFGLTLGGGVKLPVGSYNQEKNGTRLAIDLQPGTGSTDAIFWGNLYKGFQPLSFALFLNTFYRYAGANLDGYRFGDELIFSLNGEYYLTEYLTLALSLRSRFANEDFWGGRFLPSTGGTYHDLLPALVYAEGNYNLRIFYQAPVYRNVRGIQLTTDSLLGAEMVFNFNLTEN